MPSLFGETVVEMGFVTQDQLEEAIKQQKKGRAELGQIMKYRGTLSDDHVAMVIKFQNSEEGNGKKFGDCAVIIGLITDNQRDDAVKYQTTSRGVLGDLLIELGFLTRDQRDEIIKHQISSIT